MPPKSPAKRGGPRAAAKPAAVQVSADRAHMHPGTLPPGHKTITLAVEVFIALEPSSKAADTVRKTHSQILVEWEKQNTLQSKTRRKNLHFAITDRGAHFARPLSTEAPGNKTVRRATSFNALKGQIADVQAMFTMVLDDVELRQGIEEYNCCAEIRGIFRLCIPGIWHSPSGTFQGALRPNEGGICPCPRCRGRHC